MDETHYLLGVVGATFSLLLGLIGWLTAGVFRRLDKLNGSISQALIKIAEHDMHLHYHTERYEELLRRFDERR